MPYDIHNGPVRITYCLGGERHTRWTQNIHVDAEGFLAFVDAQTGKKKFINGTVEYAITELDEFPPDITTIETAGETGGTA